MKPIFASTALIFATLLGAPACSTDPASDQQVIYIPTKNGVEAERVSAGVPDDTSRSPQSERVVVRHLEYDLPKVRAALLTSSDNLEYLGQVSQALFIVGKTLEASFSAQIDYKTRNSICKIWVDHVEQKIDSGNMRFCGDRSFTAEIFVDGQWHSPKMEIHSISYNFERLHEQCREIGGRLYGCYYPPLQGSTGSGLPFCVVVRTQLFRTSEGREFALIEGTDPAVYGVLDKPRYLTDPQMSEQTFSRDYSKLRTRDACEAFFRDEAS